MSSIEYWVWEYSLSNGYLIGIPLRLFFLLLPFQSFGNKNTTTLPCNPKFHSNTKNIELNAHFIREKIALNSLQVCYVSSFDQTTDTLVKTLTYYPFCYLRDNLTLLRWAWREMSRISKLWVDMSSEFIACVLVVNCMIGCY